MKWGQRERTKIEREGGRETERERERERERETERRERERGGDSGEEIKT